jgi:tetratricopeptide (TPR) repeat protein
MITEKTEQQKENLSLEETEKQLKQELAKENFPPEKVATVKMQLTEVLIKRAKTEMIYMNQSKCTQLLEEAWNLSPQMPEVVIPLARSLLGLHKEEQAELILKAYVKYNPDDMEALKLYVRAVYKKNPWDALKLCYPNKQPHPKTTESLLIFIPDVLLACFNARSEPPDDAPFDRIGCYERLIEMKRETSPLPILQHKVKMNPNSAGELIALAKYYYGQQEYFEAVAILQKSIDIKPTIEAKELLQQAIRNRGVDIYTFCQAIVDGDVLKYKGYIVKGTGPCVRSGSMSSKSMYQSYDVVIPCAKSRTRGIFLVSSISAALDIVYGKDLIPIVLGDSSGYSGSRVNFSGRFEGEFQYVYIEIKGRKRLSSLAPESESHAPLRKRQRQVQPLVEPFIDDDISKSVPVLVNCTVSSY